MKILQVLPDLKKSGGVEQGVLDLVKEYPDMFWVASAGGTLADQVQHHITMPLDTKNPVQMVCNAWSLVKLIRDQKIDIIHVRSRAPAWSVLWACQYVGIPWIATYHGLYNAHNALKKYYNSVMTRGQTVIAISNWMAEHIRTQYLKANISVIYEGIDTKRFAPPADDSWRKTWRHQHGIGEDKRVVLLPGRLTRWKGQHVLLGAAQHLDPSWEVVLLGDVQQERYAEDLKRMAQDLSVRVRMLPSCGDMRLPYAGADVVVSCSTDPEAFGRVTAEVLSMERAYVGTNHGGSVELTNHGQFGQLVPPGDARALADALKEAKPIMGSHGYIQQHYDVQKMYQQTMGLYKRIVSLLQG